MNNRDIGLLVLEMPSSFSYAEESFYWDLNSPDISLLLCSSISHLRFAAAAIKVVAQGLEFHIRTWILLYLGWGGRVSQAKQFTPSAVAPL